MKLTLLLWAPYTSILKKAYDSIKDKLNINIRVYSTREMPERLEEFLEDAKDSDIVLIYRTNSDNFYEELNLNVKNLIITGQNPEFWNSKLSRDCYLYMVYGGLENFKNLILFLLREVLKEDLHYEPPKEMPMQGIYYKGKIWEHLDEFLEDVEFKKEETVGILFSRHYIINEDTEIIDKLIESLERYFNVIPVFTYGARNEELKAISGGDCILKYFFRGEERLIDALINMLSFPLETSVENHGLKKVQGVEILKKLNVPVFHPIVSYYQSYEEWKRDGLKHEIWFSITLPEFEGVIEPIIIGVTEKEDGVEKKKAIDDRIEKLVNRVRRWINLKKKPKKDRKVVFVLHSSACSSLEATIGSAAHLDTFESLVRIMRKLKEEGYFVENIPKDGNELAKLILEKKAFPEFRWTTVSETIKKGGYLYIMSKEEYLNYLNSLPEKVREEIKRVWGEVEEIVITGLKFGNIYICVQPKRGCVGARCDGSVCKILHDPDCPPTHQYLATYKYFNDIADLIVHVGTHGTLEFLPGKNVCLSKECYPDICIGEVPHLYIYNSDNPPEGSIAKRRSYALIIDHMQTVLTSSFDERLENLSNLIDEYLKGDSEIRKHQLEHLIVEEIKKSNLGNIKEKLRDIREIHKEFKEIFKELRDTIELIKNTKMNDGMHVFGEKPEGERRVEFISSILEFEYGNVKEKVKRVLSGEKIDDKKLMDEIIEINERIEKSDEIGSLLRAMDLNYIEPGPSGLITRGNYDILPTGRNFYTLDPYKVPTKSAYRVGILLAEKLIDKYLEEHGRFPENIAIYWMASDIMWSDGEGLAQILYLLGVKPLWRGGRVVGIEVIPLEELGRPRIDVTIRVSGILRDYFPNCIELVDEAVMRVAKLDEPLNMNFVKKHTLENLKKGVSFREATYRIFSSKPGTYGNGVKYAIYSSAWESEEDLKDIFLYWNSYAYGKGVNGVKAKQVFEELLKRVDLTFNKVVTDEYDLLGCCCYFGTHGGLTNAARVLSKKKIKAYYGDTRKGVEVRTLKEELERVTLSKLLNPKWIEGMKKHGYKGAGDIAKRVGRIYGWSSTTKEVENWIYDEIFNTYIKNEENREFFRRNNIYALEEISRRLLEAYQRGLWRAERDKIEELKKIYLEIEGDLEENSGLGDYQGGQIFIDLSWKNKV
ncbi:Magnesium chelatase [Methanocaldococcus infernus ME]|uniref:Magnesium chelatase n=1 Tax=Methanocaldococcus infernus (strain DSM 11812 / JCM 15783 / ME) TaxID=573063 RepID=D5VQF1_METIM|nr:cobaltochelatase subunit CobN [Methanocaldococcus infernus]ADG12804.1 Magnesium chelatase [Methanocaldococcus infernus ME]